MTRPCHVDRTQRRRRALTTPLLMVSSVLALVVGFVDPAGAEIVDPPTRVTVTPSTDLADGQTVVVTGAGFNTGALVYVGACALLTTDPYSCDTGNIVTTTADSVGGFSVELNVARFVRHPDGEYRDCATTQCYVGATDLSTGAVLLPVSFTNVPIGPPTVEVDPSTGLIDGQIIQLSGTGFPNGLPYRYGQCPAGADDAGDCPDFLRRDLGSVRGSSISAAIDVQRLPKDVNNNVLGDCTTGCSVGVEWVGGSDRPDRVRHPDAHRGSRALRHPPERRRPGRRQGQRVLRPEHTVYARADLTQGPISSIWVTPVLRCEPGAPIVVFLPGWNGPRPSRSHREPSTSRSTPFRWPTSPARCRAR